MQEKVFSLEFAAKVIHGNDLPNEVLKSRARRLYDVANVLTSFPGHRRLFVKVTTNSLTTTRRTVLQYRGPDVSDADVNVPDLALHLPYYRRKNHLFTKGKENLGISERPVKIPRTTTVRLKLDDQGLPYLATDKINANLDVIAAASIQVSKNNILKGFLCFLESFSFLIRQRRKLE